MTKKVFVEYNDSTNSRRKNPEIAEYSTKI